MKRATAALLLCALPLAAQVPYTESVEVRVHNVDVVVTDAKGKPVHGLTRADFQLFEDGKAQEISNFSSYANASGAAGVSPPNDGADHDGGLKPAAPPARKFIFYVDEMSLSQPTQKKLKAQLDRLVRETMRAGDEAMIVRPHEVEKLKMPFSGDREAVRSALMKVIESERWRGNTPIFSHQQQIDVSMSGMMNMLEQRSEARRFAKSVRKRVQQRLGELRAIVHTAADLPGRKILVLATESLPLEPGKEAFVASLGKVSMATEEGNSSFGDWAMLNDDNRSDWVNLRPLVDEIARSAATGGITIHAVQAEYGIGLLAPGGSVDGVNPGRGSWDTGAELRRIASQPNPGTSGNYVLVNMMATNTEATLRTLAEKTGGTWHRGGLSFDNLVDAIVTDVSSYYSLGYRATGDYDQPHRIEVRVKGRPELRVRARREVLRKSPDREMTDRVVASLLAPVPAGEVPVRVEAENVDENLSVTAHVPLSALTFLPDGDKLKASFSVHYAIAGEHSDFVSGMHGTQVVEVTPDELERAKSEEWAYVIPMSDMRRQRYTVAVGVMDTASRQTGFAKVEVMAR